MIRSISSFLNDFYELYQTGGPARGESAGWSSLDPFYSIRRGQWTVITGVPGHGKSSFLDNVIVNTARDRSWKWLVFSAENQPAVNHAAQLASIYIGRPFGGSVREGMRQDDWLYASAFLDTQVKFLELDDSECTVDRILDYARMERIDALVIDPWNELDHRRPSGMTETEYISESLTTLRRYARQAKVHVFVVAHPTKLQRQKVVTVDGIEKTVYPVPTPWDISGSAHWRNKADNCLCVWRDVLDETQGTEIHVQKIRFRRSGRVGLCKLAYDGETGRFIDPLTGDRKLFDVKTYRDDMDALIERHEEQIAITETELESMATQPWSREPGEEG
jgi:twinkle protein